MFSGSGPSLKDRLGEGERPGIGSGNAPGRDRLGFLIFFMRVFGADWIPWALGRGEVDNIGVLGVGLDVGLILRADGDDRNLGIVDTG